MGPTESVPLELLLLPPEATRPIAAGLPAAATRCRGAAPTASPASVASAPTLGLALRSDATCLVSTSGT